MLACFRSIIVVTSLCLSASALATTAPDAANGLLGVLDTPSIQSLHQIPIPRGLQGTPPWKIACFDYPGYRVKQLSGDGEGDNLVSAQVLAAGSRLPVCGPQDDPGEKMVSKQLYYFMGAKGGFLTLVAPEGYQILVYDAISGRQVYKDTASYTDIRSFDIAGDTATITYTRRMDGHCSVLTGNTACWQRFVREAKLPPEFAPLDTVTKVCATEYQRLPPGSRLRREDLTVLTYLAKVMIDRSGRSTTLSRTSLGCTVGD